MELIKNFGIDPKLLGAQIINFLIILYLMRRFLYKPVLELLEKRRKMVEDGVENAQKAQIMLDRASEKEKDILRKAREEAKIILTEARAERLQIARQMEQQTKKQTELMLAEAKEQIAHEAAQTEKKLAAHVSELAIMFLQKAGKGVFSQKDQETVIKQAVKKLKQQSN